MTFFDDIKSKHLSNYVLVTIGDPVIHHLSTQKVTLDEDYYKPILLNIPSISESLDVENRKYKISSVRLSISDYEEDGVRFSDSLNTLMNKEVNIYYASQSSKNLDDCYHAGTFIIRSFTQDEDKVGLSCEDLSQDKLHKDLPLESLSSNDWENVLQKHHNKSIPMVFGQVDKSPCVAIINPEETGELMIMADEISSETYIDNSNYSNISPFFSFSTPSPLFVFRDDTHLNVISSSSYILSLWNFQDINQYYPSNNFSPTMTINVNISPSTDEYSDLTKSPLSLDFAAVITDDSATRKLLITEDINVPIDVNGTETSITHEAENFGDTVTLSATQSDGFQYKKYVEKHLFNQLPDHVTEFDNNDVFGKTYNFFVINYLAQLSNFIGSNKVYRLVRTAITTIKTWTASVGDSDISFNSNELIDGGASEGTEVQLNNEVELSLFTNDVGAEAQGSLNVSSLTRHIIYLLDKFHSSDFYIQAIGRGGATPTLQSIYSLILAELDFDTGDIVNNNSLGQYAFTLDKKISSKKLLEEISASSGLFPYFKNGNFNVKSINTTYAGAEKQIKAEDVLSYKYDRTKIEKVYASGVNVKYHYDYGLKDFTDETGFVEEITGINYVEGGYSADYFGEDFDQELVFESKYIRHKETALNLAKYLYGLHANQHNLITVKLPLNYLTHELGDIVEFDKMIQGRKIFGEDYTSDTSRNGQLIYPYFFITQIKKNLDSVEVKLYQLHSFDFENAIVWGCTDLDADNYGYNAAGDYVGTPNADDGSCTYPDLITGCMQELALNFNSEANVSGACLYIMELEPPVIEFPNPNELLIIPLEQVALPNTSLISNMENDSSFDNNTVITTDTIWSGVVPFPFWTDYENLIIIDNFGNEIESTGSGWTGHLYIFNSSDIVPESLMNSTIINLTHDKTGTITASVFVPANPSISEDHIRVSATMDEEWMIDVETNTFLATGNSMIFIPGDEIEIAGGANVNSSSWLASPPTYATVTGGDGSLRTTAMLESSSTVNHLLSYETGEPLYTGDTVYIEFKIRRLAGNISDINIKLNNEIISSDVPVYPGYTVIHGEHTVNLDVNNSFFIIDFGVPTQLSQFEIDYILIEKLNRDPDALIQPILGVGWLASPNLLSSYDLLPDYEPAGYYSVEIYDDETGVSYYYLSNIEALTNDMIHQISFSDIVDPLLPQSTELTLKVTAHASASNIGTNVYDIPSGSDHPTASHLSYFSWGEIIDISNIIGGSEEGEVGGVTGNGDIASVVSLMNAILYDDEFNPDLVSQFDVDGDGEITMVDLVQLVQQILNQ